jgi:arylsulfatase A-like enzyme
VKNNRDRPFFLLLAFNGPYGLGGSLLRPARNRHAAYYADQPMVSFPRNPPHPWLRHNRQYINNIQAMRRYAAEISGIDDAVGRILETVRQLGLTQKTLIIFTADQGLAGGQNGMWGMGDHSRPLHAYDSTMHIPMIWNYPSRIEAGRQSDILISNYDLFPTLLSFLGLEERMTHRTLLPGRDFSAVLQGRSVSWDNVVFFEFENTRAIRTGDWKYVRRFPDGPHELYHLKKDPGEWENLFGRAEHHDVEIQLRLQLESFFKKYADPKYDLWREGRSQTHLLTGSTFENR